MAAFRKAGLCVANLTGLEADIFLGTASLAADTNRQLHSQLIIDCDSGWKRIASWVFNSFELTLLCDHERILVTSIVDGKFDIGVHGFPFS